ncbi:MAG: LacI family DNA-binding transcriptional regulator [Verrucomicrobiota bacterium]
MAKRATIRDVAREAGVGVTTASNIVNQHPGSSYKAETRGRVLRAVQTLEYSPNWSARTLRTRQTLAVGVVVSDLLGNYFSDLIYAVEKRLDAHHYQILLCQSHGDPVIHERQIQVLRERNVDGLLVQIVHASANNALYRRLEMTTTPIVYFDSKADLADMTSPLVESNQPQLTRLAVDHLWKMGHREIFFLSGSPHHINARERREGFLQAMSECGVPSPEGYIVEAGYQEEHGQQGFQRLWESRKPFTALIASSIYCGYGVMGRAREMGLKIPEDFSLVTIGGGREAARMGLTDIDQNPQLIGETMSDLLLTLLHDKNSKPQANGTAPTGVSLPLHHRIEPMLHIRQSTQEPKAQSRVGARAAK